MENIITDARSSVLIRECGEELKVLDPKEFVLDPKYFQWGYSDFSAVSLRVSVIQKLKEARKILKLIPGCEGWGIKIWDGFRVLKTQKILYQNYWNELAEKNSSWSDKQIADAVELFVSPASFDPLKPSPHNTGGAVDLTLIDGNGKEVLMGSDFDEFNERSFTDHFANSRLDRTFHENRMLFKSVMEKAGFANLPTEWWHFSYGDQMWAAATGADFAIYGSMEL